MRLGKMIMDKTKESAKQDQGYEVTREGFHSVFAFYGFSVQAADQWWIEQFGTLPRTAEEVAKDRRNVG